MRNQKRRGVFSFLTCCDLVFGYFLFCAILDVCGVVEGDGDTWYLSLEILGLFHNFYLFGVS